MKDVARRILVIILTFEAGIILKRYKPKIIAISGSVGKTLTKDAVFAVVSKKFHSRKNDSMSPADISVPLTILGIEHPGKNLFGWCRNIAMGARTVLFGTRLYPDWLILEIGADTPGLVSSLVDWLAVDIVIMTHIGTLPTHIEFFGSIEHLIEEKRSIIKVLKRDGLLVVASDDPASRDTRLLLDGQKAVACGEENAPDIAANEIQIFYDDNTPVGTSFALFENNLRREIKIHGIAGKQIVFPCLAAFAVGEHLGVPVANIVEALEKHATAPGRMKILKGLKKSVIIDDSQSASPMAVREALKVIKHMKIGGQKVAILGDMLELGDWSAAAHKEAGKWAAETLDMLVTVGLRARGIAEGALDANMSEDAIFQYESADEAGSFVETMLDQKGGDIVLIKGSRAMHMEEAVAEIADPL